VGRSWTASDGFHACQVALNWPMWPAPDPRKNPSQTSRRNACSGSRDHLRFVSEASCAGGAHTLRHWRAWCAGPHCKQALDLLRLLRHFRRNKISNRSPYCCSIPLPGLTVEVIPLIPSFLPQAVFRFRSETLALKWSAGGWGKVISPCAGQGGQASRPVADSTCQPDAARPDRAPIPLTFIQFGVK